MCTGTFLAPRQCWIVCGSYYIFTNPVSVLLGRIIGWCCTDFLVGQKGGAANSLQDKVPKMSGFELYRKIRDSDNDVKVCFLTAFEVYYDEFSRVFQSFPLGALHASP
jgi:hypothetical protein